MLEMDPLVKVKPFSQQKVAACGVLQEYCVVLLITLISHLERGRYTEVINLAAATELFRIK